MPRYRQSSKNRFSTLGTVALTLSVLGGLFCLAGIIFFFMAMSQTEAGDSPAMLLFASAGSAIFAGAVTVGLGQLLRCVRSIEGHLYAERQESEEPA